MQSEISKNHTNDNSNNMPNWGVNTKAQEAKARKDAVRREENERKQKEAEDKYWEDNDKHVN